VLRRSQLFVPGNDRKKLEKAAELEVDSVIIDLEDAVPEHEKVLARTAASKALMQLNWKGKEVCVRINSLDTKAGYLDAFELSSSERLDTIVVPKAESAGVIENLYKTTGKTCIPLVETAKGFLGLEELVRAEGVVAVAYGPADFALSVGGEVDVYGANIYVKTKLVVASKAYGLDALDKVFFKLGDLEGLRSESLEAKKMGYTGKQLVHPAQIPVVNAVFSPTPEEIKQAEIVVQNYEQAIKQGAGAVRMNNSLIDAVHYRLAKKLLDSIHEKK
jgi:citrate lyase subunit beta/citryl-CoA lyase